MRPWRITLAMLAFSAVGVALAPRLAALVRPPASLPDLQDEPSPIVERPRRHPSTPAIAPHAPDATPWSDGPLRLELGTGRAFGDGPRDGWLTVTVLGPEVARAERPAVDLTVVVDTSGSMRLRGRIDFARRAILAVGASMRPGDTLAVVGFDDVARLVIPRRGAVDLSDLRGELERLNPVGETNLEAGLRLGAREAARASTPWRLGRLILLSDGAATVGATAPEALLDALAPAHEAGIGSSAHGLGLDHDEHALAALAALGGGAYRFIEAPRDLPDALLAELDAARASVAAATRVDVTLPDGVEVVEVFGATAARDGGVLSLAIGDVYHGEPRRAVVRLRMPDGAQDGEVSASIRYTDVVTGRAAGAGAAISLDRGPSAGSSILIERAIASEALSRAARSLGAGDAADAARISRESAARLWRAADDADHRDLEDLARSAEEAARAILTAPEDPEGRRAEALRAGARAWTDGRFAPSNGVR
jgi:Ca-activated chloride channel homolog